MSSCALIFAVGVSSARPPLRCYYCTARLLSSAPADHTTMTNHQPVATTDATSERRLARSLGYPASWHVARTVIPDPSAADKLIVQDRIFAGDPAENADLYYNHGAAFEAASSWVEGESTPYDGEGGQMLPKQAKYKKNDDIQVKYDDGKWYNARITKVSVYPDDVRYTVLYTKENTYQNNVTEDEMRPRPKKAPAAKPKGRAKTSAKKGAAAKASTPKSKKGGGGKKRAASAAAAAADDADPEELELASEIGLPEGWTARAKANSNYTIYSPGRTHRFTSKKAAFEHAGIDAPPAKKKAKNSGSKKKAGKKQKEEIVEEVVEIEEGDPPWRTDGHDFLQKKVKMTIDDGSELVGTVLGWIADTDVDKEGEPGFVSESTGKPACLFHVKFGSSSVIDSQDYEEYELEGKFVDE